jgi:RimJ/RimL family protein N-acetyltransferase
MEQWWPPLEKVAGPVFLREWTRAGLPAIEAASQDPYIPRITTVPGSYTPAAGDAWLTRQRGHLANRRACPLAVVAKSTGEGSEHVVGFAAVNRIDWGAGTAAVGYWILAEERGHGYAKAALALLSHSASLLGLRRLEALIERDNLASQATARAVGFAPSPQGDRTERLGDRDREMLSFLMELSPPAAGGRLVPRDR